MRTSKRLSRIVTGGLTGLFLAALPGLTPAKAVPAAQAIASLNAQRAANGIPAGITENPDWSAACAAHNQYEQLNGGTLEHYETPGNPGYSDAGNWAAAHSVLSAGGDWSSTNPWQNAPLHLNQLMDPRLNVMGVDDSNGYTCATTLASLTGPASTNNVVYTYPGTGVSGVAYSETAAEGPYTPGQLIGIPQGTATGPYLFVMLDGPTIVSHSVNSNAHITAASLTGPAGPVAVDTVDNYTHELTGSMPPGGEIIPVSPLAPNSTYQAHVSATIGALSFSYDWSFTTAPPPPLAPANGLIEINGRTVSFSSDNPVSGALTATRPATGATIRKTITPYDDLTLNLASGTWQVCVHQDEDDKDGYTAWDGCAQDVVKAQPKLQLSAARRGRRLAFTLTVAKVLLGRQLTMTVRALPRGKTRTVKLRVQRQITTLHVGLGRRRVRVRVTSPAFQVGDVVYAARQAIRTYR
jgi:hypothetical protein